MENSFSVLFIALSKSISTWLWVRMGIWGVRAVPLWAIWKSLLRHTCQEKNLQAKGNKQGSVYYMHHSPSLHLISQNDSLEKRNELAKKKEKEEELQAVTIRILCLSSTRNKNWKKRKGTPSESERRRPHSKNFFCGGRLMHLWGWSKEEEDKK